MEVTKFSRVRHDIMFPGHDGPLAVECNREFASKALEFRFVIGSPELFAADGAPIDVFAAVISDLVLRFFRERKQ